MALLPLTGWAQEPTAPSPPPVESAPEQAAEQKVETSAPEQKAEPKVWYFTALNMKKQGPVSVTELRELIKIKVVEGGTPLLRAGQEEWTYPGHVAAFQDLVKWHFMLRGKKTGPVDTLRLKKLVELKVLSPQSTVWRAGLSRWKEMVVLPELQGLLDVGAVAAWKKKRAAEEKEKEKELEEESGSESRDDRMGRFFVTMGGSLGANIFADLKGMALLGMGGRFSAIYVNRPFFHIGLHATYTRIDAQGLDEDFFKMVEGINDFAFGATVQLGKQFSHRLWFGFGLDLGVSAIRSADLIRGKEITVTMDLSPHLYTAPRAQLIYLFFDGNSRAGIQASLSVPVLMANVSYDQSYAGETAKYDGLAVWSGIYLNLELVLGFR